MENEKQQSTSTPPQQKKEWFKKWWGILLIIFAFPIAFPIFVWTGTNWHQGIKIAITIFCGLLFIMVNYENGQPAKPESGTEQASEEKKNIEQEEGKSVNTEAKKIEEQTNNKSEGDVLLEKKAETPKENIISEEAKSPVVSFGSGTHIIGTDIQAGTYRSEGAEICYWSRLSDFSEELDDIIANGNNSPEIITISTSDAAFKTSGCGQWVAVEDTYPATLSTSFSDGTYKVGKHIAPGTYRADGSPDDLCYWARLSNFSHAGTSGIVTNGISPTVIQISNSDKGFSTFGCGNWSKIK